MKLNSKGQVTIPAQLRAQHGLHEGDEVDVVEEHGHGRAARAAPRRMITLVDSGVLLDVLTDDRRWATWSSAALADAADAGPS